MFLKIRSGQRCLSLYQYPFSRPSCGIRPKLATTSDGIKKYAVHYVSVRRSNNRAIIERCFEKIEREICHKIFPPFLSLCDFLYFAKKQNLRFFSLFPVFLFFNNCFISFPFKNFNTCFPLPFLLQNATSRSDRMNSVIPSRAWLSLTKETCWKMEKK